jgi:hypothetical protein
MHRHPGMHVQKILGPRHSASAIYPPIPTPTPCMRVMIRHRTPAPTPLLISNFPLRIVRSENEIALVVVVNHTASIRAGVCGAAVVDAELEREDEDRCEERYCGVDEGYGEGLGGEVET